MKKKFRLFAAFLAVGVMFAGSLAVFSDSKKTSITAEAGTVVLNDITVSGDSLSNMGAGHKRSFAIETKYDGTLPASAQLKITRESGDFATTGTDKFILRDGSTAVSFSGNTATINLGEINPGDTIKKDFQLELGANAPKGMQAQQVKLDMEIVATQKI